ncbi:MAG: 1,4-alpha-glucan branching protein GlgB [Planctomycetota bacterium]
MQTQVSLGTIGQLIDGSHPDPASVLGAHPIRYGDRPATAVRAFRPGAQAAWIIDDVAGNRRPMRKLHPAGFFEAICDWELGADNAGLMDPSAQPYHIEMSNTQGETRTQPDPYIVQPLLGEMDRYLLGEGKHYDLYECLGAQVRNVGDTQGVNFAVWAPNARSVQIVGDFNRWDGRGHVAKVHPNIGIWELFVPQAKVGDRYKFRIHTQQGHWIDKSDPVGFAAELPPLTASVVANLRDFSWDDGDWMQQRLQRDPMASPMNVYEVHLGSWQQAPGRTHGWLNYRDLAKRLTDYCHRMNFTHVELMPVSEHPFTGSWGYQTVGYFAPTSRHGDPEDFMYFVDYLHRHGLGVIIDWAPAHFPKDGHGLAKFDGSALYEHADSRQGEHPDWGTLIFNYGRNEVRNFLVANALFWLDKYHIDGLRVDAVASMLYLDYSRDSGDWVPNQYGGRENLEAIEFVKEFNALVHEKHPGAVTIAEESTAWGGVSRPLYDGGLGFTYKWNMGWMNDTLSYMQKEPIHRSHHQNDLTFSLIYAFSENFMLPLSHDEVVHGKGSLLSQMPGDMWQQFANLRLLYSYMWTHPGKKLLFMGGELGMWNEWDHDRGPEWELLDFDTHRGIQQCVADLNRLVIQQPALHQIDFRQEGFEWVDCMNDRDSSLIYLRKGYDGVPPILVCHNFTPVVRSNYRVGVPMSGFWKEIFNSDSEAYGGSNVGNYPGLNTTGIGHHARPDSINLTLPPLATTIFRYEG